MIFLESVSLCLNMSSTGFFLYLFPLHSFLARHFLLKMVNLYGFLVVRTTELNLNYVHQKLSNNPSFSRTDFERFVFSID